VRRFSRADKSAILTRAGGRCEHHGWLFGRCRETIGLEADHVHPWSRGGPTAIANGQALCRRHNRLKRATVPFAWQLRALEKRRAAYFPPGVSVAITRRARR
jgi:5-methylcytosine-specific restriction endonuclease McrA